MNFKKGPTGFEPVTCWYSKFLPNQLTVNLFAKIGKTFSIILPTYQVVKLIGLIKIIKKYLPKSI